MGIICYPELTLIHIVAHPDFHTEVAIMKDKLASLYAIVEDSLSEVQLTLDYLQQKENAVNEEYYELNVTNDKIHISAITPHGIFNGIQTFLSLLNCVLSTMKFNRNLVSKNSFINYQFDCMTKN